jgi:hypothetical protein
MTGPVTKVNAKCDMFYIQWLTRQEGFTGRINKQTKQKKTFHAGHILIMKATSATFNAGLQLNQLRGESSFACNFTRIFLVQAETLKQYLETCFLRVIKIKRH